MHELNKYQTLLNCKLKTENRILLVSKYNRKYKVNSIENINAIKICNSVY